MRFGIEVIVMDPARAERFQRSVLSCLKVIEDAESDQREGPAQGKEQDPFGLASPVSGHTAPMTPTLSTLGSQEPSTEYPVPSPRRSRSPRR